MEDREKPVYKGIDENDFLDKLRANPWIVSTMVLGLLVLTLVFFNIRGFDVPGITGNVVSQGDAAEALVKFAKPQLPDIKILDIKKENGLYKMTFTSSRTGESSVYTTLNGKYLVAGLTPLITISDVSGSDTEVEDTPKSDKPEVQLVITSYCPYGIQGIKGIIPVVELLGDKIDFDLKYFNIPSHGEKEEIEGKRQICIREQQSDKFLDYVKCFIGSGDSESCLQTTKIDKNKLTQCMDKDIQNYYSGTSEIDVNVGSSPTLLINEQEIRSGRSPSAYLSTICSAFNNPPKECETQLSSSTPNPGFGSGTGSSNSAAQC